MTSSGRDMQSPKVKFLGPIFLGFSIRDEGRGEGYLGPSTLCITKGLYTCTGIIMVASGSRLPLEV